jgi:hypothetical protein
MMRVPLMHAWPWHTAGSTVIRSRQFIIPPFQPRSLSFYRSSYQSVAVDAAEIQASNHDNSTLPIGKKPQPGRDI